jgi:hypothetical protein
VDRFLKYTTGREPVISSSVIAALLLGAVVLVAERLGITFSETELLLLGSAALIAAGYVGRRYAIAPDTYAEDVSAALHAQPPEDD